jgi:hypothetical protein
MVKMAMGYENGIIGCKLGKIGISVFRMPGTEWVKEQRISLLGYGYGSRSEPFEFHYTPPLNRLAIPGETSSHSSNFYDNTG